MSDDVTVVRDERTVYDDGTIARVRVLSIPVSEQYPAGVKYAFHYGEVGASAPIIRFDNHHGPHELHLGPETYEIEYPGLEALYEAWRAALPSAKRIDW
ncbi:MAG: toxin-antitoxin system TumE family protein [Halovenus sp.]